MRDLTKLGFADDLAFVAGLEDLLVELAVYKLISLGASTHHWAGGH